MFSATLEGELSLIADIRVKFKRKWITGARKYLICGKQDGEQCLRLIFHQTNF
jgi:hypothetical protein